MMRESDLDEPIDYTAVLRAGARRIAACAAIGFAVATLYAFLAPKWYEAQLTVVPGMPSKSSAVGSAVAALGADLPLELGSNTLDVERIQAVFKSRSVTDEVIKRFDLRRRYDEATLEATRAALWSHCSTRTDKKSSTVALTCEDRDPQMAQKIAEYFGEIGNAVFRRISESSAGEERRFLEQRVAQARHDVDAAARALREFQEQHKLIDIGEQSKAIVSALAALKGELLSKEIQLSYLNSFSSSDEATARQLREQVAIMQAKMRALEESAGDARATPSPVPGKKDPGLFPPAMTMPKLRYELEELIREQKVQETLFLLLTQRYEIAKVNEARDTSAFQILDAPVVPTRKSRPKRLPLMLAGLLVGLLAGAGLELARAQLGRRVAPRA